MESSVMLGSISFFLYNRTSAFFCDGDAPRHWRMPMWGGFCDGDGNQKAKATAEERLYKTRNIISTVGCALCSKKAWLHFCSHALVMIM